MISISPTSMGSTSATRNALSQPSVNWLVGNRANVIAQRTPAKRGRDSRRDGIQWGNGLSKALLSHDGRDSCSTHGAPPISNFPLGGGCGRITASKRVKTPHLLPTDPVGRCFENKNPADGLNRRGKD